LEPSLTKSDLVKRLAHHFPGVTVQESRKIIELFLESMKEGLKTGDTVEMRDFGVLRIRSRTSRKARNPRTGARVLVDAKKVPYFKQSRILKERLKR
jgi:nucleoid DNA-binding protein